MRLQERRNLGGQERRTRIEMFEQNTVGETVLAQIKVERKTTFWKYRMMAPQVTEARNHKCSKYQITPCFVGDQYDKADNLSVEEIKSILWGIENQLNIDFDMGNGTKGFMKINTLDMKDGFKVKK